MEERARMEEWMQRKTRRRSWGSSGKRFQNEEWKSLWQGNDEDWERKKRGEEEERRREKRNWRKEDNNSVGVLQYDCRWADNVHSVKIVLLLLDGHRVVLLHDGLCVVILSSSFVSCALTSSSSLFLLHPWRLLWFFCSYFVVFFFLLCWFFWGFRLIFSFSCYSQLVFLTKPIF